MTPDTRRRVIRYGIALDLVILATGVGLLLPGHPYVLLCAFIGACCLAAWKGGWAGGVTAIAASLLAIVTSFWGMEFDASLLIAFVVGSVAAVAAIRAAMMPRAPRVALAEPATEPMLFDAPPNVIAFERTSDEQRARYADLERLASEEASWRKADGERRKRLDEERLLAEAEVRRRAEAAEDAERKRLEAEREALQRQLEEQQLQAEETRRRHDEERARLQQQLEAERLASEETARRRVEEERAALEAKLAAEHEAARLAAEAAAARKVEEERRAVEAAAARKLEEERQAVELRLAAERAALEAKLAAEHEAARLAAEEAAARKIEEERKALEQQLAAERAANERLAAEAEAQRLAAEETARKRVEEERVALEAQLAAEAEKRAAEETARRQLEEQLARERAAMAAPAPPPKLPPVKGPSLSQRISSWFRPAPKPIRTGAGMNLRTKKVVGNDTASRRKTTTASAPAQTTQRRSAVRKPRLLLLEKRRGTADTIVPKLRVKGVEVEVVERWIDAIDEMFRFRPDAIFIDSELPDFEKVYRSISENNENLPIYLTGRSSFGFVAPPSVKYVSFVSRPYETDIVAEIATKAMRDPGALLAQQTMPRGGTGVPSPALRKPAGVPPAPRTAVPEPSRPTPLPVSSSYNVTCFNCRVIFDAVEADWCSCLTKERTLVCTNCLTCFCKAAPSYKEKFWVEAPPKLFERKTSEGRRAGGLPPNLEPEDVLRPMVLAVEDDEDIQSIVQRVCQNLGYGFVYALNGQEGLELAHLYRPNLILSDAFMPKLDGREMCRMLKEEPSFADTKMVVMTGLYTDTKYRSEALKRFHVDDYLAKPVAVTDLINLLQKHLEGVSDLPMQEDLHQRDRAAIEAEIADGVPLADLLEDEEEPRILAMRVEEPEPTPTVPQAPQREGYQVCCFTCQQLFDATTAEWCSCVGRDNTLRCPHCQTCFCKAPSAYRERFWMDAPPSLFERKMIGSRRAIAVGANPVPDEVKRPLILLVEDDENVQLIVRTVVTSMGFGFIAAANGQEGLLMAHEYRPDLILSDAFMPKLDGREMCRLLKEDPATSPSKAIIMTGLYTDRKYRNEALDYFKVDDYVAKPLAVDDLIKLFKKHLPQEVHATM
ncbi:MAG TPA: response regulator [Thermoanaerobaculia bacterium]|jgi:CheY-like chemotaxis protein|nr:response regulator [Thermoanaerobaculia bacterium]